MNIQRNILLNPGPATTTDTVKMAQIVPDICPRERAFGQLMRELGTDLLKVVHANAADWATVLFCGSGTLCIDACVSSLVPAGKKLLIVNNGAYSARAAEIARAYSVPHINLTFPADGLPDLDAVESTLAENPDIAAVYTTHQETGTGILNPVREIGALAHAHDAVMIADTISTYAMIPFSADEMNVDVCMSSAQKGIQGMTGLSFVIAKKSLLAAAKDYPVRSYYTNLVMQYEGFEETGEMRFMQQSARSPNTSPRERRRNGHAIHARSTPSTRESPVWGSPKPSRVRSSRDSSSPSTIRRQTLTSPVCTTTAMSAATPSTPAKCRRRRPSACVHSARSTRPISWRSSTYSRTH